MTRVKDRIVTSAAALALALTSMFGLAGPARAVDGTIEINHDAITASPTGYPYTIAAAGSYRLTSNLIVPSGKDGIVVFPNIQGAVSIDLNGFDVSTSESSGTGIQGSFATVVSNGSVRGFRVGVFVACAFATSS
jgi:hypothetical protein